MSKDDSSTAAPRRARRPRGPALSVDRITQESLALIDEGGLDAFSFRSLAARLGCQAMSIYNYYPSKAHLYEALVDICLKDAMNYPEDGAWQVRMRAATAAYRRMALRHPGFFLFLATFRLNSHSGMAFLDRILRIYAETGLPAEAQARHFRIMGYFLVGAMIDETMGYAKGPSSVAPVPGDVAARDFPAIMAVGPYFGTERHALTFDTGVEALIDAIEAEVRLSHPSRSGK
jgi:AcrR family transcriptional regulator